MRLNRDEVFVPDFFTAPPPFSLGPASSDIEPSPIGWRGMLIDEKKRLVLPPLHPTAPDRRELA
ncbi:hypothetical protein FHX08_000027 [Rhizobium sp. BK529]|uniref:hypothetical protein n=1 Tax=unclassified Rhizobium TaxID=2613769 RepID=UPI0016108931|nr:MULTISPECIES: hypothetical protein [unclassified Rhizobium]MBB3589683.1 hypothetical protein [Rhizobium sp. BK529]